MKKMVIMSEASSASQWWCYRLRRYATGGRDVHAPLAAHVITVGEASKIGYGALPERPLARCHCCRYYWLIYYNEKATRDAHHYAETTVIAARALLCRCRHYRIRWLSYYSTMIPRRWAEAVRDVERCIGREVQMVDANSHYGSIIGVTSFQSLVNFNTIHIIITSYLYHIVISLHFHSQFHIVLYNNRH